ARVAGRGAGRRLRARRGTRARAVTRLTHIGGPTLLIEHRGWRLLTDPTFDPPGRSYRFGWGTGSRKLAGPALAPEELGELDAILLTPDHPQGNPHPPAPPPLP